MSHSEKLFIFLACGILVAFGVFIAWSPPTGRLEWENKTVEIHPSLTDNVVTADFKFTNTGKHPVTIEFVKSGCGCTTAVPDRNTYQPGEKGRVTATFNIGERTGLQEVAILVKLTGENERVKLTLIAHLPELMTVTPQLVYWQVGDAPEAKAIALRVESGVQLKITNVVSIDPFFNASLETIQDGKEYRLLVRPENTASVRMAAISIDAIISGTIQKSFTVYPNIKSAEKK